jgi:hypothetical protein
MEEDCNGKSQTKVINDTKHMEGGLMWSFLDGYVAYNSPQIAWYKKKKWLTIP